MSLLPARAARVWAMNRDCGYVGTGCSDLAALRPARPPASDGSKFLKPSFKPCGPIGLLLVSVHECGAAVDGSCRILQYNEPPPADHG